MMDAGLLVYELVTLGAAIIIFWFATGFMLEQKRIVPYVPFFGVTALLCFQAAFTIRMLYLNWAWFGIEAFLILIIASIVSLARGKK
jgi:hypothetical protein